MLQSSCSRFFPKRLDQTRQRLRRAWACQQVSLQPSSKSAGMQSSGHFGSQWQHMFGRHWWHDLPINHPKHPFFARSADPRSLQQQAPAFAGEGSKSSSKCACPPVKPENPHAGMFSRGPHKRAAAKPADHVLQHQVCILMWVQSMVACVVYDRN